FAPTLATYAHRALQQLGVEIRLHTRIDAVDARGVIAGGERIDARVVVWGAGVKATPVAAWLGVEANQHGTVSVNRDFSLPGNPDVFVIGDAARTRDAQGAQLPALAAVAK